MQSTPTVSRQLEIVSLSYFGLSSVAPALRLPARWHKPRIGPSPPHVENRPATLIATPSYGRRPALPIRLPLAANPCHNDFPAISKVESQIKNQIESDLLIRNLLLLKLIAGRL